MNDSNKQILFEQMPIPGAVARLVVPTIMGSLVMILYNLADTYFVGYLNDPVQNAAVTLAAPMLLAFVLTPTIERNLYRTLMVNNGSLSIFWERPITLGLLIATAVLMVAPVVLKAVRKGKKAEAQQ